MNIDDQQYVPQLMPEYTLPIMKGIRESSPAHGIVLSPLLGFPQPLTKRLEPLGAYNSPKASAFEGSSVHKDGYRPFQLLMYYLSIV